MKNLDKIDIVQKGTLLERLKNYIRKRCSQKARDFNQKRIDRV